MASSGVLQVRWHGRLDTSPLPLPNTVRLSDKVEGMLLGLAIGDALGNTSESINPSDRLCRHGWIENYLPNRHAAGRPIDLPSDDTQLAAWTMEQLIEDGRLEPQLLGQRFAAGRIFEQLQKRHPLAGQRCPLCRQRSAACPGAPASTTMGIFSSCWQARGKSLGLR